MSCRIISHRGLCRKRFWLPRKGENTIEAFEEGVRALEAMGQQKAIELDVRAAKDGALVVRHGERLGRSTNGFGKVCNHTLQELKALDAGYGRKIPLLSEVLEKFKNENVEFNIELKERGVLLGVKKIVMEHGLAGRTILSCFDDDGMWEELPRAGPELRFAFLAMPKKIKAMREKGFVEYARTHGAYSINPRASAVTENLVRMAHEAGLEVRSFTVNRKREFERFSEIGVDAVFSDNPRFLEVQLP